MAGSAARRQGVGKALLEFAVSVVKRKLHLEQLRVVVTVHELAALMAVDEAIIAGEYGEINSWLMWSNDELVWESCYRGTAADSQKLDELIHPTPGGNTYRVPLLEPIFAAIE